MSAFYGFKANPKRLVEDKAHRLFGRDAKVAVTGARPAPPEAKRLNVPVGHYLVDVCIDGQFIAAAHARDWRKAYGLLVIEVEKAYEASLTA